MVTAPQAPDLGHHLYGPVQCHQQQLDLQGGILLFDLLAQPLQLGRMPPRATRAADGCNRKLACMLGTTLPRARRDQRLRRSENLRGGREATNVLRRLHRLDPAPSDDAFAIYEKQADQLMSLGAHYALLRSKFERISFVKFLTTFGNRLRPTEFARGVNFDAAELLGSGAVRPLRLAAIVRRKDLKIGHAVGAVDALLRIDGHKHGCNLTAPEVKPRVVLLGNDH